MSVWRDIATILDIGGHVYVREASCEQFGFKPRLYPFESPALGRKNSDIDIVQVSVLVDPVFVDEWMLPDPCHESEAEITVNCSDAPPCRDKLPSLVLAEHAEAERSLNSRYQDTISVQLQNRVVRGKVSIIERFLDSVVSCRIAC